MNKILLRSPIVMLCMAAALAVAVSAIPTEAARFNAFGQRLYTVESEHFRIHYHDGLDHVAHKVGAILEDLYETYRTTYQLTLPSKTEVLLTDDDRGGGWALAIQNMIHIWANDFEWPYRGTQDHLRNVVAHEYAHIASIWTSFKMPAWMPYIQFGYFSHPNQLATVGGNQVGARIEAFHVFPSEILPPWFFEGIAQYESARNEGDTWDTHRDMILRTLTVSDKLLSWDHMSVFAGKEDDYEKTYNHGFSLVSYIADTYGYDAIVAILREASELGRLSFDRAIRDVLGIPARTLYRDWTASLDVRYTQQIKRIGKQVYGRKINNAGYDNQQPRFGPGDAKIYFLSNDEHDYGYSFKSLYSYALSDTVDSAQRIALAMPKVKGWYDIHKPSAQILFSSMKSKKSVLPPHEGGMARKDLFIDSLPSEKKRGLFAPKTERQVTYKKGAYHGAFSPDGKTIAYSKHVTDKFYLCLIDSSGKRDRVAYPSTNNDSASITTIYSIDWSPDGRRVVIGYADDDDRKIGVYDTLSGHFFDVCDTPGDERHPRFGPSGETVYFSSDRTGVFNIYRYRFNSGVLQRLTNVSGGAFSPDVDSSETRLVYVNYDASGFSVYLIDSIQAVSTDTLAPDSAMIARTEPHRPDYAVRMTRPRDYSHFPRQFLFIPTVFTEQILTEDDDAFSGITDFKAGGVVSWNDPFDWAYRGSSIGAYFLLKTSTLADFFSESNYYTDGNDLQKRRISPNRLTYDWGAFASTTLLPIDLSAIYAQRSIAGRDWFLDQSYGYDTLEALYYNLKPSIMDITASHWFSRSLGIHALAGYDTYKVLVASPRWGNAYLPYTAARGSRFGAYTTFLTQAVDRRMNISPRGLSAKLKYEFWSQNLQNEIKSFVYDEEKNQFVENYDAYRFNQVTLGLKYGRSAPWLKKHDLAMHLDATALKLTPRTKERLQKTVNEGLLENTDLPSYYKPGAWLPGYAYYYKDTAQKHVDTVLISGNGIVTGGLSYRFPLTPQSIDKKLGFLYFDQLYMGFNAGAGTAKDRLEDFRSLARDDFLMYSGAELRLEAISFNTYPLAIGVRWDWGMDKPSPVGGHKFALQVGFNFEDWGLIVEPDGATGIGRRLIR